MGPTCWLISEDGKKIFTTNIQSNSVSVWEREGPAGPQGTTIPVGKGPEGIDMSSDGREVWVAHSQDGGISIIDVGAKKVVQTLSISTKRSNRLKFTPDDKRVLVSDMDGDEVVVAGRADTPADQAYQDWRPSEGIQMTPDGSRAFVALAQEGAVVAIDLRRSQSAAIANRARRRWDGVGEVGVKRKVESCIRDLWNGYFPLPANQINGLSTS